MWVSLAFHLFMKNRKVMMFMKKETKFLKVIIILLILLIALLIFKI